MKKLLLDENLPRKLKYRFGEGYEVITVPEAGWSSKKNGELLAAMAENQFQYLITADQNLRFQQNLNKYDIKIVILIAENNRYETLLPYVEEIKTKIETAKDDNIIELVL